MTEVRPGTSDEEAKRGMDRRTLLRAGVIAGGASATLAAAVGTAAAGTDAGTAAASPRQALSAVRSEAASATAASLSAAAGQAQSMTVAEYVVERLAALGIEHVFGVPGDYAFPFDNVN